MSRRWACLGVVVALGIAACESPSERITGTDVSPSLAKGAARGAIGVNVLLSSEPTNAMLKQLGGVGRCWMWYRRSMR